MWVITDLSVPSSSPTTAITVTTDEPAHLWLAYGPPNPTYTARYKFLRGVQIPCGYHVTWRTPNCDEQAEPGDSLTHTFSIASTEILVPTTIAFAEACPIIPGVPATPPISITIGGAPLSFASITVATNVDHLIATVSTRIIWDVVLAIQNWPMPGLPNTVIVHPDAPATFDVSGSIDSFQSLAGLWRSSIQTGGSFNYGHVDDTFGAGGPHNQTFGPLTFAPVTTQHRIQARRQPFSGVSIVLAGSTQTLRVYH